MRYKGSEEEAMYLATSVIADGSYNTRMALNIFLMAMISHPDILSRAREEMDAGCVGEDGMLRLLGMAELEQLPYLAAMVKEVLRWRPTTSITPQHQLTEGLEDEGYLFLERDVLCDQRDCIKSTV
ncbi:cytochrome P450 [Penicillium sp. IBT 16267x]|nr:cytochrome P450 [Penicillium sp. IBT 16267x]